VPELCCRGFSWSVCLRGGVLKTQTIFGPQLFKAVNKVFKSTSLFPWYKSFSLTCKAQRKFHPSIPNFYLKRHLGYSSPCKGQRRALKGRRAETRVPPSRCCARCGLGCAQPSPPSLPRSPSGPSCPSFFPLLLFPSFPAPSSSTWRRTGVDGKREKRGHCG